MAGSEYYDHTTYPATGAAGTSAALRAELDAIESGFGKLPTLVGTASKLVRVNAGQTALEASDAISLSAGSFVLPQTNTPAQTANGSIVWDADTFLLTVGDGTSRKTMVDVESTQSVTGTKTFTSVVLTTADINGGTLDAANVGATTPGTGAFTTLSASSTVSGAGFSTYLASPPAIGGTTPASGKFTTLTTTGAVSFGDSDLDSLTILSGTITWEAATVSHAGTAATHTFPNVNVGGNLGITGSSRRITGDFTNATIASRSLFQTSTVNGQTRVEAIPNGTSDSALWSAYSNSTPTNASRMSFGIPSGAADARLTSDITGSGSYLPLTVYTSATEKFRIAADTTGTYTFGGTAPRITGDFSNATTANRVTFQTSTLNSSTCVSAIPNGIDTTAYFSAINSNSPTNASVTNLLVNASESSLRAAIIGTGTYLPLTFYTNGSERIRIDTSGYVGIGLTPTARNNTRLQIVDGIGFPATQVASSDANTLDDYEEGTFTISMTASPTNPTYSATATYTKVGRKVFVTGTITLTTVGSGAYTMPISSLPYTPITGYRVMGVGSILDEGNAWYPATIVSDSVSMWFYSGSTAVNNTAPFTFGASDSLMFSIEYIV